MDVKNGDKEKIREKILSLIDTEFESDAAFERAVGLADKTVNNWRRGRSSSYMRLLPTLSERFGVTVGELLDIPLRGDTSELSEDEIKLLTVYRRSRTMPKELRAALRETLEQVIHLYMKSANEIKSAARERRREIEKLTGRNAEGEA
jgi:transcriptional regulator with XRE-family HTH domain